MKGLIMNIKVISSTSTVLAIIFLNTLPITNLSAKEIAIYRWVDANNVVHFSQNLPKKDDYTQLSTVSSFKALSKEARKEKALQEGSQPHENSAEQQQLVDTAKNKATFERNCKSAQANIEMLNSFDEILITEETSDGVKTERVLDDKEKKEKLALSKKHVDLYCDK
jgi:hypothetical protein